MDNPRLLIVEDDDDLLEMLGTYFSGHDYDVRMAGWGADALRISREESLHLVVLDITLPDIDGYEICRQLRADRQTQDTPVIFLTEKRARDERLQGLELGVVDYITKPFDLEELHLRVRNAISRVVHQTMTNAVTDLPEGGLVEKRLDAMIQSDSAWAVLVLAVDQWREFRERYGFVAADDVLRAVALMIGNAVRELGDADDFVGHLATQDFVVITRAEEAGAIRERLETRMEQSSEYFYPMQDREEIQGDADRLRLICTQVDSSAGPFASTGALFDALDYVPRA